MAQRLSFRDIGFLLTMSPQRVLQLDPHMGRSVVFARWESGTDRWSKVELRHAVALGDKHKVLCGAPLWENSDDEPWAGEARDDSLACEVRVSLTTPGEQPGGQG
jgi:hypothetical protein